ncbi:ABC transporter permease [Hoeflea sp. G2-23]|uniref:Spermidine/putrescine transport system permease protein PotC n=1 Tax=Hoeflea algicola TaxID=2983763 RepID=A0ABT3ZEQ4_9HYPH|nr:ABC transporter permease [Hoeflea algicola]MCY0150136.1 ABC transporter permease [Hoeflea algicola]
MGILSHKKPKSIVSFRGFGLVTGLCLFILYVPMMVLVFFSFNANRAVTVWGGFSFQWYVKAASNSGLQNAALNSLTVAVIATTLATAIATAAALATGRGQRFRGAQSFYMLVNLPLMLPEIIIAVGTLSFFALAGMQLSLVTIVIAHTVFCIPFAYLPIRSRLETMDGRLEEAAADLYASPFEAFRYVTMPLLMPGIVAGAMLAFVVSLDDFIITAMVAGAGSGTLPVYVYTQLKQGVTPEINAISTVLLAVSVVLVSASYFVSQAGSKTVRTSV